MDRDDSLLGKGERVRKTAGANSTYTLYDEAGRWLGDYDGAGSPLQQAIWLDALPVGLLAGATQQLHYIEPDHLGTPRAVIDPVRDVAVWKWDVKSEAFGNSPPHQDPDADDIAFVLDMRFPGQRYDNETGLNYNYFRDYDSSTGSYAQSDPIGLLGGVATYAYVEGNPLSFSDFLGLSKGGKRNISVDGFNKRSDPKDVEKAIEEALRKGARKEHIKALRGLLKVIKRGGTMAEGLLPGYFFEKSVENQCGQGITSACAIWCKLNPEECKAIQESYLKGLSARADIEDLSAQEECPAEVRSEAAVPISL